MKHIIPLMLTLSLLGCRTRPAEMIPFVLTTPHTPVPTAAPTLTPRPTEVPLEALPMEVIVQKYLVGEIADLSSLNLEQHAVFSRVLVEKMREKRGTNVIYYTYKGDKYFINPSTLESELVPANPDQKFLDENTLEMYWPLSLDTRSRLVVNVNGEPIPIENSIGTDWNMVVTDPHDSRIDWPDVAKLGFGNFPDLTLLQFYLAEKDNPGQAANIVPIVILDKNIGEIILEAGPAFRKDSFLKIMTIETDASGNPVFAKVSLVFDGGTFVLQEEGSSSEVLAAPRISKGFSFLEALNENTVYYLGFPVNQSIALSEVIFSSTNNLDGFAPMDQNLNTLTGNGLKHYKMSLIYAHTLIKRVNN